MTKRKLIPILFALVVVPACGDDGGGGGGGGGSVTATQFSDGFADVSCAKEFDCCTAAERMDDLQIFKNQDGSPITTEAQCDTALEGFIGAILGAQLQDSIAKGRISFDEAKAGTCLANAQKLTCAEQASGSIDTIGECQSVIAPLVAIGGACSQNNECKNSYCDGAMGADGSNAAVDGACTAFPGLGETCTGGDHTCAPGQFCTDFGGGVCQATVADGMDCMDEDNCTNGHCNNENMCGADTRCVGN